MARASALAEMELDRGQIAGAKLRAKSGQLEQTLDLGFIRSLAGGAQVPEINGFGQDYLAGMGSWASVRRNLPSWIQRLSSSATSKERV